MTEEKKERFEQVIQGMAERKQKYFMNRMLLKNPFYWITIIFLAKEDIETNGIVLGIYQIFVVIIFTGLMTGVLCRFLKELVERELFRKAGL